jgi:hypothetical protein
MDDNIRRVASNEVIVGETVFSPCVVEIMNGKVINYYHFENELPLTEWLGGTIIIVKDTNGILRAYQDEKML